MPKAPKPPTRFPALLIFRHCAWLPVAGESRAALGECVLGAWVDAAALANARPELGWARADPGSALFGPGAEALSLSMERDLGFEFHRAVNEAWREAHPECFPPHREALGPASRARVLEACSGRSALALFCSAPDERVWGLSSLDERHGNFPDEDSALAALGYVMGSSRALLEQEAATLGWSFPLRAPLLYHRELGSSPPREMSMPLTRLDAGDHGHWAAALANLGVLAAESAASLERLDIGAAISVSKGSGKAKRRGAL